MGAGVSLTLLPAPGTLFLLLGCLVQLWYEGFCLVLLNLFCPVWLSLGGLLFSEGGVDLGERGGGGAAEGEWREGKL